MTTFHATDDDLVLVLLGDHQPASIVTGPDASHDVPITILARDPAVLEQHLGVGLGRRDAARPGCAGVADGRLPRPVPHRLRAVAVAARSARDQRAALIADHLRERDDRHDDADP